MYILEMATKRCPRGSIRRASYTRKNKVHVPSSCIKNVGLPGKGFQGIGPGIGELQEGELSRFGYEHVVKQSTQDRHTALRKAVKEYGALVVWRKLNAVQVLSRHTSPITAAIFLRDRNWVKRTFGISKKE